MHDLQKIRQNIRNSPVGEKLSKIERWSKFRTDETTSEWLELLGSTAIVLTHQEHFTNFVLRWAGTLEPNLLEPLVLAGSIHDLGEATIGDIANPDKTKSDEQQEFLEAIIALKTLGFEASLESELESVYHLAIIGENEILHYLFKALEKTEYLDTAIHLFTELNKGKKMNKGHYMIARILAFDLTEIINYSIQLPNIVGNYLKENATIINEMFIEAKKAVDDSFEAEYDQAQSKWKMYLTNI